MFDTIRATDTRSGAAQSFRFGGRSPIGSILWLLSLLFLLSGLIPLGAAEQSSSPSIATRFLYDADGQRVGKQTVRWDEGEQGWRTNLTRFLIDPQHPSGYAQRLAEAGEAGEAGEGDRAYLHGLHPIAEVGRDGGRYALVDGHGSVRGQVEEGGGLAGRRDYDAFGSQLAGELTTTRETDSEAVGYAGEFYDSASGLQDLRARQYEPLLGRFRTMDSFEGRPELPAGLHKYVYCENEPVNNADPSGQFTVAQVGVATGISSAIGGLSGAVYGGIKHGVEGAFQYGLAGSAIGPLATAGIMTGGAAAAGILGVSEGTGVLLVGSAVNAYGIGSNASELVHAETPRERAAALFSLSVGVLGQGAVTRGYLSIRAGRGTFQSMNPSATSEEIVAGRLAADYFGADIVAQAPQGVGRTADYRIVLKGKTLELKNVTDSANFKEVTHRASHAQSKNVMIIVKPGQLSQSDLIGLSGRLLGPNSPSQKHSITVIEESASGFQVIYGDKSTIWGD